MAYLVAAAAGVLVLQWVFSEIGAGWPAPRWYYWCDAWIFVGSMVATYAMARGWNDFWLAWIAVDLVGVPLLWHSQYYPTAILFVVYGVLVVWGFFVWLKASRVERRARAREGGRVSAPQVRLDSVERAVADIAAGKAVVVVDDEDRENEGDLIFAASRGHPGADGVHDPLLLRRDLRAGDGADARPARDPADDAAQPRADADGVHRLRRRPRRHQHRHLRRRPLAHGARR